MAPIRSRKRDNQQSLRLTTSAAATLLAFAVPHGTAIAQDSDKTLPTVNVTAPGPINDYKPPEKASSPKYTAPLLDTPQSITVIPQKVIEDQNLQGLRDVLSTVPGITFGAGEGGGGFGDSINLRGFSSNSDITVDGVRDSGQYTRSDTFNLEQVEITNGANSAYAGSGAVGGSINLVSKVPKADDNFSRITGGLGTDNYGRATADINRVIADGVVGRLNLMVHKNDAPGRDYEDFSRWGVAPSITFGLGSPTRMTLSYVHQKDDNLPQYGVPYANGAFNNGSLSGVDTSNYYGYHNVDTQEINSDAFTAILDHEFNNNFSVRNLTRYQRVTQDLIVDPPQGTWCLANGINPYTGATCGTPGLYSPSGPRGNTRDTENTMLYNQTDFSANFKTGFIEHTFVTGFSFSSEDYRLDSGNSLRTSDGTAVTLPPMSIADPDSYWNGPVNFIRTSKTDGELDSRAIYAFDNLKLSPHWELNGGIRWERVEGQSRTDTIATPANGGAVTPGQTFDGDDTLFSYRAGIVFKPVENASVYVAYSNSETPSQGAVNSACGSVNNTSGVITNNCNLDPEQAVNYELGGKWEVFNRQLTLTAAVFRNERTNYKVASGDVGVPDQQLDGRSRVDGLLLGVGGLLTKHWSIFANYAYLKSKVLQNASDFSASQGEDPVAGDPLTNVPKNSASLWTTYDLPAGWQIGYGVTYQGKMYVGQSNNFPDSLPQTDSYWVHRAMVSYKVNRQLSLQLNINNIFDKEYYARIRNNATSGWATPGDGRQAVLTASYQF